MKKYNLSKIMKRAWELVKKMSLSISEGLKKAWKEAKSLKEQLIKKMEMLAGLREGDGWHYEVSVNDWKKYGKDRTYFAVIETRDNSKRYVKHDCGYYDNISEKYVAGKHDLESGYDLAGYAL